MMAVQYRLTGTSDTNENEVVEARAYSDTRLLFVGAYICYFDEISAI